MTDTNIKGGYRDGSITLEQAKQAFNRYYEKRAKSKIGMFRAKLFDMMYQKKDRFTLKPGEPGSERYLLEEGPRTFDMEGVDWFPEGDTFSVDDNPNIYTSKGSTHKKDGDTTNKIYGPRIKEDGKLYSEHFKETYNKRTELAAEESGSLKDKSLVEIYWEKYRENPEKYSRKNKSNRQTVDSIVFTSFAMPGESQVFTIKNDNLDILYDIRDEEIIIDYSNEHSTITYLTNLRLLKDTPSGLAFNKNMFRHKIFIVTAKDQDGNFDEFILNIVNGNILNEDLEDIGNFYEMFASIYDLSEIIEVKPYYRDSSDDGLSGSDDSPPESDDFPSGLDREDIQEHLDIRNKRQLDNLSSDNESQFGDETDGALDEESPVINQLEGDALSISDRDEEQMLSIPNTGDSSQSQKSKTKSGVDLSDLDIASQPRESISREVGSIRTPRTDRNQTELSTSEPVEQVASMGESVSLEDESEKERTPSKAVEQVASRGESISLEDESEKERTPSNAVEQVSDRAESISEESQSVEGLSPSKPVQQVSARAESISAEDESEEEDIEVEEVVINGNVLLVDKNGVYYDPETYEIVQPSASEGVGIDFGDLDIPDITPLEEDEADGQSPETQIDADSIYAGLPEDIRSLPGMRDELDNIEYKS